MRLFLQLWDLLFQASSNPQASLMTELASAEVYIPRAQYVHTLTPLTNLQVITDFGDIMARTVSFGLPVRPEFCVS